MLIAVYGSLREGCYNNPFFLGDADKKGTTLVEGRLYSFGAYPGLVKEGCSFPVECEVYEVNLETYNSIDAMERGAGYFRTVVPTKWGDADVWCYPNNTTVVRSPQVLPKKNADFVRWEGP